MSLRREVSLPVTSDWFLLRRKKDRPDSQHQSCLKALFIATSWPRPSAYWCKISSTKMFWMSTDFCGFFFNSKQIGDQDVIDKKNCFHFTDSNLSRKKFWMNDVLIATKDQSTTIIITAQFSSVRRNLLSSTFIVHCWSNDHLLIFSQGCNYCANSFQNYFVFPSWRQIPLTNDGD